MDSIYAILLIAAGSIGAASFYVPFKKVKDWAWESYWISQGIFAWLIIPWLFAFIFIPWGALIPIIREAPSSEKLMAAFFGILWGFGGLTFGLSLRYLGVALGQSIALGLCAAFGTLLPPIIAGDNLFSTTGGILTVIGVAITVARIIIIGYAGSLKSKEMSEDEKRAAVKEFALLEPNITLVKFDETGKFFERLATLELLKSRPFGSVWDYYCLKSKVPVGQDYIHEIIRYENEVLSMR